MNIYHRYFLPNSSDFKKIYLIHGLGEYSGRYKDFIKFLNNNGFGVYTFDLPGHGYSSGKRGDIENFYEIYSFLEEYVSEEYFLFGHSLGGLIASRFTELTDKKPRKLVLSSPALGDIRQADWLLALFSFFPKLSFSNRINPNNLSTNEKSRDMYINDPLVHDRITVETTLQMFEEAEIALREIHKISIPSLLLYGEEDKVINTNAYKNISNPNIDIISFPKGKHELFECLYNRDMFLKKIITFLKQ